MGLLYFVPPCIETIIQIRYRSSRRRARRAWRRWRRGLWRRSVAGGLPRRSLRRWVSRARHRTPTAVRTAGSVDSAERCLYSIQHTFCNERGLLLFRSLVSYQQLYKRLLLGTCESEISARIESRIESGGSRLHVQCRLSCGSCVCALAAAVQLHVKWSCKHISQLQTVQRLMFLSNSEWA